MKKIKENNARKKNIKEKNTKIKKEKGITLIALVVTIIVLLLLAGVSIAMLTGENGILTQANKAKIQTEDAGIKERIQMAQLAAKASKYSDNKTLKEYLEEEFGDSNVIEKDEKYIVTVNGKEYEAGSVGKKVEIGDFINYDAGIWTPEEITKIGANGTTALPTRKFGGFTKDQSRNTNATPLDDKTYNYVKTDEAGKTPISGWRVFDIEGDTITLISAGNPEDYYHQFGNGDASEKLLTQTRDWTMYENEYAVKSTPENKNAKILTKARLDKWYNKYMGVRQFGV